MEDVLTRAQVPGNVGLPHVMEGSSRHRWCAPEREARGPRLRASPEIILIRHGPSAHAERQWVSAEGFRQWMTAYDAAEIAAHPPPSPELLALARSADLIVASDLPRARASAARLAPGREVRLTPLLREAPFETPALPLPRLGGFRVPLQTWAIVLGARWLRSLWRGVPPPGVDDAARARAEDAAGWLAGLAEEHGRLLAVTHGTFRTLVAATLARHGWRVPERRPFRTWSVWRLERG